MFSRSGTHFKPSSVFSRIINASMWSISGDMDKERMFVLDFSLTSSPNWVLKKINSRKFVEKVHPYNKSVWFRRAWATSVGWWVIEMFLAFSGGCSIRGESLLSTPYSTWASVKSHTCPWASRLEDIRVTLEEIRQRHS